MTPEKIKEKVLQYKWEFWFDRPFGAFFASLFRDGQTRVFMKKTGVDAEWPAILFQNGAWYKNEDVWNQFEKELQVYLDKGGTVYDVVRNCEKYAVEGRKTISKMLRSKISAQKKLEKLYALFTEGISYVMLAHGFDHLYAKVMREEVSKYIQGEIEKNIGDISYPMKKNAHHYFEKALRSKMSLSEVHREFGWIKARGGFADGFTLEELAKEREQLKNEPKVSREFTRPFIPKELKELAGIAQELVYFRTLRSDILYELMYLSRPILTEIANSFGLTFPELRDYSALDLMNGKIEKYELESFSAVSYGKDFALFHTPILSLKNDYSKTELRGSVAFPGKIKGRVKVVMTADEIGKVENGDILVAPTTAPSYVIGMKRAGGFVTDEGGITSHAAIVSREMKKPCIIGTKISTKVLKDGDLVEVDAELGIVKILKKK